MTRIKLTKDSIIITTDGDILIPVLDCDSDSSRRLKATKLKQQILDDHENAGKVDNMYIRVGQLIQENKQLKEEIDRLYNPDIQNHLHDDYENLKETVLSQAESIGEHIEKIIEAEQKLEDVETALLMEIQTGKDLFKNLEEKSILLGGDHIRNIKKGKEILILKEKLRKYEILQYSPKELEIELNKYIILKLTLEEIKDLNKIFRSNEIGTDTFLKRLEKILKENK